MNKDDYNDVMNQLFPEKRKLKIIKNGSTLNRLKAIQN